MKRILSMILVAVLSASLLVFAMAANTDTTITFSDVDKTTTEGQAIYKLAQVGILKGDGDGTFRPNDSITRGELSKIVNSIFAYTEKSETTFSDLTGGEWFYEHALIAREAGYIVGSDNNTFVGYNHVTREQACAILCRVASLYDLPISYEITDPVSEWAKPYVQKVLANAMMTPEEGNTFRAQQNITRAEFSVVFANFVQETATATPTPTPTPRPNTGSGGSGGSGGGGNTDDEPNYAEINKDMLTKLGAVSADINKNQGSFTAGDNRDLVLAIKACIDDVIKDGQSNVIDASYVITNYKQQIDDAKVIYDRIAKDSEKYGLFIAELDYLDDASINWLGAQFGVGSIV